MTCYSKSENKMFIHIPKTGGVAITRWMRINEGGEWFAKNHHGSKHFDINSVEKHLKLREIDYSDMHFFTVVRHPLDRLVSAYHYYQRNKKMTVSFEEYIKGQWADHKWGCAEKPQFRYIDDRVKVHKFESFKTDFPLVERKNKSNHKPWQTYYNDELIDIVYSKHKKDFDLFGYAATL